MKKRLTLGDLLDREKNSFGVLRLAAASAVIIDHSFEMVTGIEGDGPLAGVTALSLGQHAVNVFFVLSGILVAASLDRSPSLPHYLVSRALRILPGLTVCVFLTAFLIGPLFSTLTASAYFISADTYLYVVKTISLATGSAPLPLVFSANPIAGQINIPLWTIKYEVICYFLLGLLPFIGLWRNDARRLLAVAGVAFVYVAATAIPGIVQPGSSLQWFLNLSLAFAMGIGAYVLRHRLPVSTWILIGVVTVFTLLSGSSIERPLSAVLACYAAIWFSQFRYGPFRRWTNMVDLSFGIYIYGWVSQQCVVAMLPELGLITHVVVTFIVLLPIAALSWFIVEKPSLGLRHVVARRLDDQMDRFLTAHDTQ
ncbi:MAG: acyltransferase [Filomicrobium sp.]